MNVMQDLHFPITELKGKGFLVRVDLKIYAVDAITATSYKYTDKFFVHQETSADKESVVVTLESRDDKNSVTPAIAKQYCNDLVDQQVRYIVNQNFGHIRDLIVEEAFKPVSVK
jgi:His-Xaa-Ser system protein HxsD